MSSKLPVARPVTIEQLTKSFGDVHSRLFDHHPSLQGEIIYFVKEMEEKRHGRESVRLQKAEQYSQDIGRHLEDATNIQLEHFLPAIQEQVDASLKSAEKIFGKERKPTNEDWLKERRQKRVAEWSEFMDVMCERSSKVDTEVDDELRRVNNYYREMEKKLNIMDKTAS